MQLSLSIIESYNLPRKTYRPDYDDAGFEFTLPSGIVLSSLFMCNGQPCVSSSLEGLDGYIYIETKEELDELVSLTYEQTLQKIKEKNKNFKIEKYL